jgi:hypothetical protein
MKHRWLWIVGAMLLIGAKLIQEEAEKSQTKENEESVKATGETDPVDSQHTSTPVGSVAKMIFRGRVGKTQRHILTQPAASAVY